jgi:hypothetical protein
MEAEALRNRMRGADEGAGGYYDDVDPDAPAALKSSPSLSTDDPGERGDGGNGDEMIMVVMLMLMRMVVRVVVVGGGVDDERKCRCWALLQGDQYVRTACCA